jgi:O-antigen ligase
MTTVLAPGVKTLLGFYRTAPVTLLGLVTLFLMLNVVKGHDLQRLLELAFLVAAGLALVSRPARWATGWPPAVPWLAGLALLSGVISAFLAAVPAEGFSELLMITALVLAGAAVRSEALANTSLLERSKPWIAATCVCYLIQVVCIYVSRLALSLPSTMYDLVPSFSNPRFFNHVQSVLQPLLVLFYVRARGRERTLWLLVAAGWWCMLAVTAGRGTMLGLGVGTLAAGLVLRDQAAGFLRGVAVTLATGLLMYLFAFVLIPLALGLATFGDLGAVVQRSQRQFTTGRSKLWLHALELWRSAPVSGVGPGHYAWIEPVAPIAAHPHNWLLQILAEWGTVVLACLLALLGLAARGMLRRCAALGPAEQMTAACWILVFVSIWVDGLVSGLIVMPASQLAIVLCLGWMAAWAADGAGTTGTVAGARLAGALIAATAAAVIVLQAPLIPEKLAGKELRAGRELLYDEGILLPRFWTDGLILPEQKK